MSLIIVGDRIKNTKRNSVGIDEFYGPYEADETNGYSALQVAENTLVAAHKDVPGQTVGVKQSDGSVKEYWMQPNGNNGNSLVEKITSDGGSATPEMKEVSHSGTTPSISVKGGEYHTFSDAVDSLVIAIGTPDTNPFAESQLEFSTSASFSSVTWPLGCKFANQQPMLVANSSYLVSILHGIVAVTEIVAS